MLAPIRGIALCLIETYFMETVPNGNGSNWTAPHGRSFKIGREARMKNLTLKRGVVVLASAGLAITTTVGASAAGGDTAAAIKILKGQGFTQIADGIGLAKAPASDKLSDGSTFKLAKSISDKVAKGKMLNFAMSYGAKGIPLFSQQYYQGATKGTQAANRIVLMKLRDVSPEGNSQDVQKQIAGIEALLNTGQIDCLSIQPLDNFSFTAITKKVMAKGIPVFTVGVESAGNELSNFTQVSKKEGLQAAAITVDWMKKNNKNLKVFAVSGGDPSATWAQGRMSGFIEGIKKDVPGAKFLNTASNALVTSYDSAKTLDAYKAFIAGNPDVEFIQNVDIGAEYAGRAIVDAGLKNKAFTIGWNLSVGQLDKIDEGVQIATLDQAWPQQAAFGPLACAMYLKFGKVMPNNQVLVPVTKATGTKAARKILASILS